MNAQQKHLLTAFQHLMEPHELMAARWLTEEWDGSSSKVPAWLRQRIWMHYPSGTLDDPERLARCIRLRLLADHKPELSLPSKP
jgi:hypothetical protein